MAELRIRLQYLVTHFALHLYLDFVRHSISSVKQNWLFLHQYKSIYQQHIKKRTGKRV